MNELTLTELDMGFSIPKILDASKPSVDHQGRKGSLMSCFSRAAPSGLHKTFQPYSSSACS